MEIYTSKSQTVASSEKLAARLCINNALCDFTYPTQPFSPLFLWPVYLLFTIHSIFSVKQAGNVGSCPGLGLLRQPPPSSPPQFHRPGPVCESTQFQPGIKLQPQLTCSISHLFF